jgi:hypothetical protein
MVEKDPERHLGGTCVAGSNALNVELAAQLRVV